MNPEALTSRADSLGRVGRHDEAIVEAMRALSTAPESASAHMDLARAYYRAKNHQRAVDSARIAAQLRPDWEWPYRMIAVNLLSLGKRNWDNACNAAARAVSLAPDLAEVHIVQAEVLRHRKSTVVAARHAAWYAVGLAPDNAGAHLAVGNVELSAKNYSAAEAAYRNSLAIDPESQVGRSNLSVVLRVTGRPESAFPLLRSNVVDQPQNRDHTSALASAADEYVKGGPLTKAMHSMIRLAFLRVTIVIALVIWPFAVLEQRARRKTLAPELQGLRPVQRTTDRIRIGLLIVLLLALIVVLTWAQFRLD